MADLPSRPELFRRFRAAAIATPNTRISPREIDRAGADANLVAAGASFVGEEIVSRQARSLAGVFEDTASGKQLDRVIFDRKGVSRIPATPAVGPIVLARPNAAAGAGTVPGGLPGSVPTPARIQTNTGVVYQLLEPSVWGAADLGPKTVQAQAELAGLAYEVEDNQGWTWADPPFDPSIVITNPEATAGAADEETDIDYRARAKAFFPTLRRGTIGAIEFGLRSTPGVASVAVVELTNASGLPATFVQAYILDHLGRANESLAARAQLQLLEFRAAGIPVLVSAGVIQLVTIKLRLAFDTALVLDTSRATTEVRAAIVAALNNLIPGKTLERSLIIAAVRTVRGVLFPDNALVEPAGDLVPATVVNALRTKFELIEVVG